MTQRSDHIADPDASEPDVTFVLDGPVSEEARARAERMIRALAGKAPRPVIFARVKLNVDEARPADQRVIAQGTLDVSGAVARAQVAASGTGDAIDALGNRLDRRIRRVAERRREARDRPPATPAGQWRHGDLPSDRPGFFPRPRGERRIVRRKTYAPEATSIEEAAFDLEVLDHRFFLFVDEDDGEHSVVYERDGGGVALRRLSGGSPPAVEERSLPVDVVDTPAPDLTETEARDRLDASDEPFVFHRDPDTGVGKVLYRRYDGHYGLVHPAG